MTEMTHDSDGTQNSNPTVDNQPGKGITPNNLGWQQANTKTDDGTGFTTVGKMVKPIDLLAAKQHRTGVLISRETPSKAPYHVEDLQCCFDIIQQIDPKAIVLNHMNDSNSARLISALAGPNMTSMDYNGFCDIQTFPWGNPREGKFKTTMLFWIASDIITGTLKELRDDSNFKEMLRLGNCRVQPSTLHESRSRMIGLFMGKDPAHSNRHELRQRMEMHLQLNSGSKESVQVNVVPFTEFGVRTLGFAVGLRHEAKVKKILANHPFTELDVILNAWKRSNREEYHKRILQHGSICKQSTAFKLVNVDPELAVHPFRQTIMDSDVSTFVVDVCTAVHSNASGVCYVQYLRPHRDAVLAAIQEVIRSMDLDPGKKFQSQPELVNPDASQAPTRASDATGGTATATLPTSKWASIVADGTAPVTDRTHAPIPRVIATPPRSFTRAMRTATTSPLDDCSVATPKTSNSGGSGGNSTLSSRGSGKTAREWQLEQENDTLKEDFAGMKHQMAQMQAFHNQQLQEMHAAYQHQINNQQAQISQLQSMMAQLQHSLQQAGHPPPPPTQTPRKLPPSKRQNSNASPSLISSTMRRIGELTVTAVDAMAPMAQEGDAVTPNDTPMGEEFSNV